MCTCTFVYTENEICSISPHKSQQRQYHYPQLQLFHGAHAPRGWPIAGLPQTAAPCCWYWPPDSSHWEGWCDTQKPDFLRSWIWHTEPVRTLTCVQQSGKVPSGGTWRCLCQGYRRLLRLPAHRPASGCHGGRECCGPCSAWPWRQLVSLQGWGQKIRAQLLDWMDGFTLLVWYTWWNIRVDDLPLFLFFCCRFR